jgi:methionyl-tRNA formyltransferase
MRISYIGSGRFGLPCLDALRDSKHVLEFILTQPSKGAGRGRRAAQTPVAQWAISNHTPFTETDNASSPSVIEKVRQVNPDLILVIAFGQKISDELINTPPKGMINVHGSLLPKYRGAAPINRAIANGESETGVTIATVTSQWDAGLILAQRKTRIEPDENAEQLSTRLSELAAPLFLETIGKIEDGTAEYREQNHNQASRAPKLKKSDGYVDFSLPAQTIQNMIRGFWPWPGVSAEYNSKATGKNCRISIVEAQVVKGDNPENLMPGTLDKSLIVVCGSGALKITQIKPAGKSTIPFEAFINGYHVAAQDRFTKIEE